MKRKIVILGGGTMEPIRNHLALCAPAFGETARYLNRKIEDSELILTKMAGGPRVLQSNDNVAEIIDDLLLDKDLGCIVLNVAFCDFKALPINGIKSDFHGERLETNKGNIIIELTPTEKIIAKIRQKRPDIFLVGFKTTTNKTPDEQFLIALKMMKSVKCNLVLANDTTTRNNMIITAEETIYGETTDRNKCLDELAEMIKMRYDLTYNRSIFIKDRSKSIFVAPNSFIKIIRFLIDNGGFIENNGNGFTPGHFCYKYASSRFISSQRKANHNLVFSEGMSDVDVNTTEDTFIVTGERKASVGARSQWLMFRQNPEFDCIIHTHNPMKGNLLPITPQKPFQCGSLECGMNTVNHLQSFNEGRIKAVFLEKHGVNIMFNSYNNPQEVIDFIKANIELGAKIK